MNIYHIFITNKCNLACGYCQASSTPASSGGSLTEDNYVRLGRLIKSSANKSPLLIIQGGEPFLYPDALRKFMSAIREQAPGARFQIVTNLTLYTTFIADLCREFGLTLCVSLDGPAEAHNRYRTFPGGSGSFLKVTDNIKKLIADKVPFVLQPVISRHNLAFYKEIVDLYLSFGMRAIYFRPVNPQGRAIGLWNEFGSPMQEFLKSYRQAISYLTEICISRGEIFYEHLFALQLRKAHGRAPDGALMQCPMARGEVAVDFDGRLYPCDEARHFPHLALGDLPSFENVDEIKAKAAQDGFHSFAVQSSPDCLACDCYGVCSYCPVLFRGPDLAAPFVPQDNLPCALNKTVYGLVTEGMASGGNTPLGFYTNKVLEYIMEKT